MIKLVLNDIPFLIGWENEQLGKEGVSQFINILIKLNKVVSSIALECDIKSYYTYKVCDIPIFAYILKVFKAENSEDEKSFQIKKAFLISKLNKPSLISVEDMDDKKFESEGVESSICSYAYENERHLITIRNKDRFDTLYLEGTINSNKVRIKNISTIEHLEKYSNSLEIRSFDPSPKHEESGWGTVLDIPFLVAEQLLRSAIPRKGNDHRCLINYYNNKVYVFRITTNFEYHGYPEDRKDFIAADKARFKKFGEIVDGEFVKSKIVEI